MLESNAQHDSQFPNDEHRYPSNEDYIEEALFDGHSREELDSRGQEIWDALSVSDFREQFVKEHTAVDFTGYLAMVADQPDLMNRTAFSYMHDALMHMGTTTVVEDGVKYTLPVTLTEDPFGDGQDTIIGNARVLNELMGVVRQGAQELGAEKRILLMLGPVGTAKSTIARKFKRSLEAYSRTDEGAVYTCELMVPRKLVEASNPSQVQLNDEERKDLVPVAAPMHEDPLGLIPKELRPQVEALINKGRGADEQVKIRSDVSAELKLYMDALLEMYDGNFKEVVANGHIQVHRFLIDESKRVGIGTFEPKDEKNIDAGELTGDEDFRQLARYGSGSDPRVVRPDGELCIGHRGMVELVEGLKLPLEVQNMFLTVTQEKTIKPKKSSQIPIDTLLLAHTNGYEYNKLLGDDSREALRDRVLKVEVVYLTNYKQEAEIYEKTLNKVRNKLHIAPLTEEMLGMWAVLTRLHEPENESLSLVGKAKLYAGEDTAGFNQRNIKALREVAVGEGWTGASPRVSQNVLGLTVSKVIERGEHLSFPHVARELEETIKQASLDAKVKEEWLYLLDTVRDEYKQRVEQHVQQAIAGDERDLDELCGKYLDYVNRYIQNESKRDPLTDEYISRRQIDRFLQSVERHIGVTESKKEQFRTEILSHVAGIAMRKESFDYKTNARLREALELTLLESVKGSINLRPVIAKTADANANKRIDVIVDRLVDRFGYSPESARDVLQVVAAKFLREAAAADEDED